MSSASYSVIELLAVELWQEIFGYFNTNELWYSFRGLNRKLDAIIDQTSLCLSFKEKGSYDYFIKNILPSINVNNIRILNFESHTAIKHFFAIYPLNSLVQLRKLSLMWMSSFNDPSFLFWSQLSSLKDLRILIIKFYCSSSEPENCTEENEYIIRSIFNQNYCPLLTYFSIYHDGRQRQLPSIPSLTSTTHSTHLKHLSLHSLTFGDLIKLLTALQNLRTFHTLSRFCYDDASIEQAKNMTMPKLMLSKCVRLYLKFDASITLKHVEYILQQTPNLEELSFYGWRHLLDAAKWESVLSIYCPKLIKLQLTCFGYIDDETTEEKGYQFERYCKKSSFWLERKLTFSYVHEPIYDDKDLYVEIGFNMKDQKNVSDTTTSSH